MSATRALAVLVGADGSVENRVVSLDGGTTPAALIEVSNYVNARLSGLTLAEAEARLRAEIRDRKEAIDRPRPSWSPRGSRRGARTMRAARC